MSSNKNLNLDSAGSVSVVLDTEIFGRKMELVSSDIMRKAKKLLVTAAICAITGNVANAQIKVLNNGDIITDKKIGIGVTNPTEKLHVYGNIKIGTFSPNRKLEVLGNVKIFTTLGMCVDCTNYGITIENHNHNFPGPVNSNFPTIYGLNGSFCIGHSGNWANSIYVSTVNYQNSFQPSDMRWKENIQPCTSLLSKIKKVHSYNYNFTEEYFKNFDSIQRKQIQKTECGFLAQELQEIFPNLVRDIDSNMLGINYIGMIPILTAAINEMQKGTETRDSVIDALMQKVESLENALIVCCNSGGNKKSIQSFELTDPTAVDELKVFQNVPNPFNETTIITCYIPGNIQKVELCVYDMQGSLLKCFLILERGAASV
jgi:hypothetical protein